MSDISGLIGRIERSHNWHELRAKLRHKSRLQGITKSRERTHLMIKVESLKQINKGNLRAFATVSISDKIRIFDLRIVQQEGQRPWVSMPSREYEKDGQRRWSPVVEIIDEKLKEAISNAVLAEYAKVHGSERREPADMAF